MIEKINESTFIRQIFDVENNYSLKGFIQSKVAQMFDDALSFIVNDVIFPANIQSFAELKQQSQRYTTTHLSGLKDINWNDIKQVIDSKYVSSNVKCSILGSAMVFDFMNKVDYIPTLKQLLKSDATTAAKADVIGMAAFARPVKELKSIFESEMKTDFSLMAVSLSKVAKNWLKKTDFPDFCRSNLAFKIHSENTDYKMMDDFLHDAYNDVFWSY